MDHDRVAVTVGARSGRVPVVWPCRNATASSSRPSNARGYCSTVASTGRPRHDPELEGGAILGRAEPESLLEAC